MASYENYEQGRSTIDKLDRTHTIPNYSSKFFALSCNLSWAKMRPNLCSDAQVGLKFIQPS